MSRRSSSIGVGVRVDGHVAGDGDLAVFGHLEGSVQIGGHLSVWSGGVLVGDVVAGEVTIEGEVHGNVRAPLSVRIGSTGLLVGDAVGDLHVARGGVHRGTATRTRTGPQTAVSTQVPRRPIDSSMVFETPLDLPPVAPHEPAPPRPDGSAPVEDDPTDLPEAEMLEEPSVRTMTSPGRRPQPPPASSPTDTAPDVDDEDWMPPQYTLDPEADDFPTFGSMEFTADPVHHLASVEFDANGLLDSPPPQHESIDALPAVAPAYDPSDLPQGPTQVVIPNPPSRRTTSPGASPIRRSFGDTTGKHPALPRPPDRRPVSSGRLRAVSEPLATLGHSSGRVPVVPSPAKPASPPRAPEKPSAPPAAQDPDLSDAWFVDEDET